MRVAAATTFAIVDGATDTLSGEGGIDGMYVLPKVRVPSVRSTKRSDRNAENAFESVVGFFEIECSLRFFRLGLR